MLRSMDKAVVQSDCRRQRNGCLYNYVFYALVWADNLHPSLTSNNGSSCGSLVEEEGLCEVKWSWQMHVCLDLA